MLIDDMLYSHCQSAGTLPSQTIQSLSKLDSAPGAGGMLLFQTLIASAFLEPQKLREKQFILWYGIIGYTRS